MPIPATHLTPQSRDWLLTESQKRTDRAIAERIEAMRTEARWNAIPMAGQLNRAAAKASDRRFSGASLTGFGEFK